MQVEDVVADGDFVVLAGVKDREFRPGFGNDGFGSAEIISADAKDFGSRFSDFVVMFLQLT